MRLILFGASGMVGLGVLREALAAPDVQEVVCVVRKPLARTAPPLATATGLDKLSELVHDDVADLSGLDLARFDGCLFPLGVSSAGLSEAHYTKVTFDLTLAVARQLHAANPGIVFVYVSGVGTDGTERGRTMWARVKGRTENAVLALLPNAYAARPGFIQPLDGIRSRTALYNRLYVVLRPLGALYARLAPDSTLTTRSVGQAMLNLVRHGFDKRVLEPADLNRAALAT